MWFVSPELFLISFISEIGKRIRPRYLHIYRLHIQAYFVDTEHYLSLAEWYIKCILRILSTNLVPTDLKTKLNTVLRLLKEYCSRLFYRFCV